MHFGLVLLLLLSTVNHLVALPTQDQNGSNEIESEVAGHVSGISKVFDAVETIVLADIPKLSPDNSCGNAGSGKNKGYTCNPKNFRGGDCCSAYVSGTMICLDDCLLVTDLVIDRVIAVWTSSSKYDHFSPFIGNGPAYCGQGCQATFGYADVSSTLNQLLMFHIANATAQKHPNQSQSSPIVGPRSATRRVPIISAAPEPATASVHLPALSHNIWF